MAVDDETNTRRITVVEPVRDTTMVTLYSLFSSDNPSAMITYVLLTGELTMNGPHICSMLFEQRRKQALLMEKC